MSDIVEKVLKRSDIFPPIGFIWVSLERREIIQKPHEETKKVELLNFQERCRQFFSSGHIYLSYITLLDPNTKSFMQSIR